MLYQDGDTEDMKECDFDKVKVLPDETISLSYIQDASSSKVPIGMRFVKVGSVLNICSVTSIDHVYSQTRGTLPVLPLAEISRIRRL